MPPLAPFDSGAPRVLSPHHNHCVPLSRSNLSKSRPWRRLTWLHHKGVKRHHSHYAPLSRSNPPNAGPGAGRLDLKGEGCSNISPNVHPSPNARGSKVRVEATTGCVFVVEGATMGQNGLSRLIHIFVHPKWPRITFRNAKSRFEPVFDPFLLPKQPIF